jgi:hypothetical protein
MNAGFQGIFSLRPAFFPGGLQKLIQQQSMGAIDAPDQISHECNKFHW